MRAAAVLALAALAAGCGGSAGRTEAPVVEETPEDEVLRIGHIWRSLSEAKGLRSAPDPVSVFEVRTQSTLELERGQTRAKEQLVVAERLELRNGRKFVCETSATFEIAVRFGRYRGQAAAELDRPGVVLERNCDPPGFGDLTLEIPRARARFVLRSDQLVAFAPPLDKRTYLPLE